MNKCETIFQYLFIQIVFFYKDSFYKDFLKSTLAQLTFGTLFIFDIIKKKLHTTTYIPCMCVCARA